MTGATPSAGFLRECGAADAERHHASVRARFQHARARSRREHLGDGPM